MALFGSSFVVSAPLQSLSSSKTISGPSQLFLITKFSSLNLYTTTTTNAPYKTTTIRMGGGPRTYPGGVSKWQWKRMQAKKGKQLLKARLARERQIYEMRKRAELKAAVSDLERPWEVVEKAPTLFSVRADDQLRVLADRFQKPGGFDMWSDKDGPELFKSDDELPSARFFPKGVVHSIKPYGKVENAIGGFDEPAKLGSGSQTESERKVGMKRNGRERNSRKANTEFNRKANEGYLKIEGSDKVSKDDNNGKGLENRFRKKRTPRKLSGDPEKLSSAEAGIHRGKNKNHRPADSVVGEDRSLNVIHKFDDSDSLLYELSLQNDGSYELPPEN